MKSRTLHLKKKKKTSLCVCLNENQSHLHAKGLSFLFLNGNLRLSYRWMGHALIPRVPLREVTSRSVFRLCFNEALSLKFQSENFCAGTAERAPSIRADSCKASLTSRLHGEQPLHFLPSLPTRTALPAEPCLWQQRIAVAASRGLAHSKPLVNKSTL